MANYAFIKNNKVVNIVVFDNPSNELLNDFKIAYGVDEIILCEGNPLAVINGDYDGVDFIAPSPFPSWVLVNKVWEPPIPRPTDTDSAEWSEDMLQWVPLPHTLTEETDAVQEESQIP